MASPLRVLHITDRLSGRGGADLLLAALISALADAGSVQHLLVGRREPGASVRCPVTTVPGLDDSRATATPVGLAAAIAQQRADVLHLHNALGPEVIAMVAAHNGLATVQDHRSFCPGQGKLTLAGGVCTEPMAPALCADCFSDQSYGQAIYQITAGRLHGLQRMRRLIVLSHYMKHELTLVGVPAAQISVVPPAIRVWPNVAAAERDCILFCGRLVRAKGALDAILAYERTGLTLPLVFAGTGPLRHDIERQGYEVLGWKDQAELGALYARARALLMPSRWQEPFGVVGLEARGAGVPVVAWHSGGIEQWHDQPELLVQWGDIDGMAAALRRAVRMTAPPRAPNSMNKEAEQTLAVYAALTNA